MLPFVCFHFLLITDKQEIVTTLPYTNVWMNDVLGYTPNFSSPFKLDVKLKEEAFIFFHNHSSLFGEIILGGWNNKMSVLKGGNGLYVSYHGAVLDANNFRSFKIMYYNGTIDVYNFDSFSYRKILTSDQFPVLEEYRVALYSKFQTGKWILSSGKSIVSA